MNVSLNLTGKPRLPLVLQAETAECGLACIAMVAAWFGHNEDLVSLRHRFGAGIRGANLATVIETLGGLHISSRAVRCEIEELAELERPAILHWDFNHFVVLKQVAGKTITLHDPACGARKLSLAEANRHFTGVAIECSPTPAFEKKRQQHHPGLLHYLGGIQHLSTLLFQMILLSALLQVVALAMPFYMQLVVDEVLARQDADLLTILAMAFALLALFSVATRAIRGWAAIYLNNQLSFILGTRLYRHLLALPAGWFAQRQMGDIVSRFGSLKPIQEFIADNAITFLLDGVMAVTTLTMLFIYSPLLANLVLCLVIGYAALQLAFFVPLRQRTYESIAAGARTDSNFMETIRAIAAIKRFAMESQRSAGWQNRFSESINARVKVGRLSLGLDLAQGALNMLGHVLVIYLGATQVLSGDLSIGMLYAFLAYRRHLDDAVSSLVSSLVKYIMLSLHLERLADITQSRTETLTSSATVPAIQGGLTLRNAGFRYGKQDRWIFRRLDLVIAPGENIAVTGPSGSGKSTLFNTILGITPLEEGQVVLDNMEVNDQGLAALRKHSASVMQEDGLLAGSIQTNITFGTEAPDFERMHHAAELACIHDDISRLPMGYDSLVGEMGASLSAGQVQRVLIARALYRQPRLLMLDEGTAHLDKETELQVMRNLLELDITCIFISHNRSILGLANRILLLDDKGCRSVRVKPMRVKPGPMSIANRALGEAS